MLVVLVAHMVISRTAYKLCLCQLFLTDILAVSGDSMRPLSQLIFSVIRVTEKALLKLPENGLFLRSILAYFWRYLSDWQNTAKTA